LSDIFGEMVVAIGSAQGGEIDQIQIALHYGGERLLRAVVNEASKKFGIRAHVDAL
jgi:hypothetical protein